MSKSGGFITLHRKILDWEWSSDPNTFNLFIHLLLMANFEPGNFKGRRIERGQVVTSLPALAKATQQTIQQTRTSLKHLRSTGEVTDVATTQYRIITIVNYDKYQVANRRSNRQLTDDQQTFQQTDQHQYNNNNNNNNITNKSLKRFIKPTLDQVRLYCWARKNDVDWVRFYEYYEANGWKVGKNQMKDWKAAVRYWETSSPVEAKGDD